MENKLASLLVVSLGKTLNWMPHLYVEEIATPKRVQTYHSKHSDTSLSCKWKINMANKKNIFDCDVMDDVANSLMTLIMDGD